MAINTTINTAKIHPVAEYAEYKGVSNKPLHMSESEPMNNMDVQFNKASHDQIMEIRDLYSFDGYLAASQYLFGKSTNVEELTHEDAHVLIRYVRDIRMARSNNIRIAKTPSEGNKPAERNISVDPSNEYSRPIENNDDMDPYIHVTINKNSKPTKNNDHNCSESEDLLSEITISDCAEPPASEIPVRRKRPCRKYEHPLEKNCKSIWDEPSSLADLTEKESMEESPTTDMTGFKEAYTRWKMKGSTG